MNGPFGEGTRPTSERPTDLGSGEIKCAAWTLLLKSIILHRVCVLETISSACLYLRLTPSTTSQG